MKTVRFFGIVAISTMILISCDPGSSENDGAYEEVVEQTDSLQTMHANLMDSLDMVKKMNSLAMNKMDTATDDSSYLATLSTNEVILEEKMATLNKVKEMVGNFESFENDYSKGDMKNEDAKAKVDEVKAQQDEAFKGLNEVERELDRIHDEVADMMDRKQKAYETDGEKMDRKD